MSVFKNDIFNSLKNNKSIKNYIDNLEVTGENPWDLVVTINWKNIGKLKLAPFELSDLWALRDWWNESINYNSKRFFPLFPQGKNLERVIANHYKNHFSKRDVSYNLWLVKEGFINADFDNEIIAHAFLEDFKTRPDIALGISDNYQSKGLGKLTLLILIYITKFSGMDKIYLSVDKDNMIGFELYKKLGFKHIGQREISIPVTDYKSVVNDMELDVNNYS
jgi:ribosomal protein S18 acetylase RimI-like enzyme